MFEFLFKYPPAIFSKGKLVLLSPWPVWVMLVILALAAAALFWNMRKRRAFLSNTRSIIIWLGQTALLALVLLDAVAPGHQCRPPPPATERCRRSCRSFPQHGYRR